MQSSPFLLLFTDRPMVRSFFRNLAAYGDFPFTLLDLPVSAKALPPHRGPPGNVALNAVDLAADFSVVVKLCDELNRHGPDGRTVGLLCCPAAVSPGRVDTLQALGVTILLDLQASEDQILRAVEALGQHGWAPPVLPGIQRIDALRDAANLGCDGVETGWLLSDDDRTALGLVAQGLSDEDIGHRLGLTKHGVNHRLDSLFHRLRVKNRTELAAWAGYHGLYRPMLGRTREDLAAQAD